MHVYIDASEWRCTMLTQKTDIALDSLQQPNLSPLHHMYGTASLIFTGNSQSHVITTTPCNRYIQRRRCTCNKSIGYASLFISCLFSKRVCDGYPDPAGVVFKSYSLGVSFLYLWIAKVNCACFVNAWIVDWSLSVIIVVRLGIERSIIQKRNRFMHALRYSLRKRQIVE